MKKTIIFFSALLSLSCVACDTSVSTPTEPSSLIANGVPWYDNNGNIVNAHGACIVEDGGKYYLFGEYKSDESNAFPGFGCYSSTDLANWSFERVALPVQPNGILGPNRVGERVKVMKCPKTGEYVMYAHADDLGYNDPNVALATCDSINGEYHMHGNLMYDGKPVKHWDIGTFQDTDGTGYLLAHHGPIYRLSDDYRSVVAKVAHVPEMGESPAMFKKNGNYYLLTSNLTSWERNDNFYYTAPSIEGPWTKRGLFCPEGSLTHNSQCTFVLPLKVGSDTVPMYMGDRWSFPHQASAATYVWLPMQVNGDSISIPEYWETWDATTAQVANILDDATPVKDFKPWKSNNKDEHISVNFNGTFAAITGESNVHSGYARVKVLDKDGSEVYSTLVDFYSKVPHQGLRFVTPKMPKDDYTLQVEVTGENPTWSNKAKTIFYGSDDTYITINNVYAFE